MGMLLPGVPHIVASIGVLQVVSYTRHNNSKCLLNDVYNNA